MAHVNKVVVACVNGAMPQLSVRDEVLQQHKATKLCTPKGVELQAITAAKFKKLLPIVPVGAADVHWGMDRALLGLAVVPGRSNLHGTRTWMFELHG